MDKTNSLDKLKKNELNKLKKNEREEYKLFILDEYKKINKDIEKRLDEFKDTWFNGDNKKIHEELSFCILTPQSKAVNAWEAIEKLVETSLLYDGDEEEISTYLNKVRFKNTKAINLVLLRQQMMDSNNQIITKEFFSKLGTAYEMREWIVKNIRGMSYKEGSHFLRNVGFGAHLAILDRHILRNLERLGIIDEIPKTLTPKKYKEIEKLMESYSKKINIPFDHLDLLFWYLEAGKIFK